MMARRTWAKLIVRKAGQVEYFDEDDFMGNEGSGIVELCRGGASEMDAVRQRMAAEAHSMVEYLFE